MLNFSNKPQNKSITMVQELQYIISRFKTIKHLFKEREEKNPNNKRVNIYHGYSVSNFYFPELLDHLENEGFSPEAPNFAFWQRIKKISEEEFERLDHRIQKTGERESLIGHSQGGLIATYLGKNYPEHIDKVIALGAPFKGTYGAFINYFIPGCQDMVPNSHFLNELDETEFPDEVEFYSIFSISDHAVIPYHNALLHENGKNVINIPAPENIGHARLITLHDNITSLLKFDSNDFRIENPDYYIRDISSLTE
jgi:pimeloyl-ACP methyl ester carboxylesterase